jgi:hypothetical protein
LTRLLGPITVFLIAALAIAVFISVLTGIKLALVSDSLSEGGGALHRVLVASPLSEIYDNSLYLFPLTWGIVIGLLIWKGKTRSLWTKQGYDHDMFKLVTRMRGSDTRVRLLELLKIPRNKLQLANELGMNWKTIDNHMSLLQRHRLVDELALVGTSKYFIISEHGKRLLALISETNDHSNSSNNYPDS